MKTHNEITEEVLKKNAEYRVKRAKRQKLWLSAGGALCLILIVSMLLGPVSSIIGKKPISYANPFGSGYVETPENYNQIYLLLKDKASNLHYNIGLEYDAAIAEEAPTSDKSSSSESSASPEHSDTNLQTVGVDEADIIKTDGNYIYAVSSQNLYIISVDGAEMKTVSKIPLSSDTDTLSSRIFEMFLYGDRLVVIKNVYKKNTDNEDLPYWYYNYRETFVAAEVFDIADRENPKSVNEVGQSGYYLSSRMIGDKLYLVTNQYIYNIDEIKPETYIPVVFSDEKSSFVSANDITVYDDFVSSNYLNVCGYSVSGEVDIVSTKSVFGCGNTLYASGNSIYIAGCIWKNESTDDADTNKSYTELTRFSLDDGKVALAAKGRVEGSVLNQFSMDEYNGAFRIVTTVNEYTNHKNTSEVYHTEKTYNSLFVLDLSLKTTGSIENLADGERVYSVRFDGDTGYFVTFRRTDPLFTVDLSDKNAPIILSALKIPGFSEYLHPYKDGLLFGLGKDADEDGRAGFLKLSMFNVSNPEDVTEESKLIIDGRYYSEASYNHKAILIDAEKNLICFPADEAYLVFSYNTETGKFEQKAEITLSHSVNGYYYGYYGSMRGLYIGDYLYVYTSGSITAYDMNDYGKTYAGIVEMDKYPEYKDIFVD